MIDFENYNTKPYAKDCESIGEDVQVSIDVARGAKINPSWLEGYLYPGSAYTADNVIACVDAFAPKVEGIESQPLTILQREMIADAISNVFAYAYAKGRKQGLEDGMFAWDEYLGCPIDESISEYANAAQDIQRSAVDLYVHYFSDPAMVDNQWINLELRFDPEALLDFAQRHSMTWKRAMYWLDRVGSIAHSHVHLNKKHEVYNKSGMFVELLYLFDMFEVNYIQGMQYYFDSCDFYKMNNTDLRRKSVDWDLMRGIFSAKDAEAVMNGISVADIFAGR